MGVKYICQKCGNEMAAQFTYCKTCRATVGARVIPLDCEKCGKATHLDRNFKACCAFCDHNNGIQDHIKAEMGARPELGVRDSLAGQDIVACMRCGFQDTRPKRIELGNIRLACALCGFDGKISDTPRESATMVDLSSMPDNTCPICKTLWHIRNGEAYCDSCEGSRQDIYLMLYSNSEVIKDYGMWGFTDKAEPPCTHLLALRSALEHLQISIIGSIQSHAMGGGVMLWCNQCEKRYTVQLAHPYIDNNGKATCKSDCCATK